MAITVVQTGEFNDAQSGSFTNNVGAGNTVFLYPFTYTNDGATISTSNPTFNGVSVTGAVQLFNVQGPNNNTVNVTIWMLPNLAGGAKSVAITVTNGITDGNVGLCAIEVSGLGASPSIDSGASPNPETGNSATGIPASGSTGNITQAAELILGMACEYGVSITAPTSPWNNLEPGSGLCQAGYQVTSTSGGSYNYNQTAGSGASWACGVVAIQATATVSISPYSTEFIQRVATVPFRSGPVGG